MFSTATNESDVGTSNLIPSNIQQFYDRALAAEKSGDVKSLVEACEKIIKIAELCSSEDKLMYGKAIGYAYFMLGRKYYANEITDPKAKKNFINASINGCVSAEYYLYKIAKYERNVDQINSRLGRITSALQNKSEKLELLEEENKLELLAACKELAENANLIEKKKLLDVLEHLCYLLSANEKQAFYLFTRQLEALIFGKKIRKEAKDYVVCRIIIHYFKAIVGGDYQAASSMKNFLFQLKLATKYENAIYENLNLLQFQLTNFTVEASGIVDLLRELIDEFAVNFTMGGFTQTLSLVASLNQELNNYNNGYLNTLSSYANAEMSSEHIEEITDIFWGTLSENNVYNLVQEVGTSTSNTLDEDQVFPQIPHDKVKLSNAIDEIKAKSETIETLLNIEEKISAYKDIIQKINSLTFYKRYLCQAELANANYMLALIYCNSSQAAEASEELLKKIDNHLRIAGACGSYKALLKLVELNDFLNHKNDTHIQLTENHCIRIDTLLSLAFMLNMNKDLDWLQKDEEKLALFDWYAKEIDQIPNNKKKKIFENLARSILLNLIQNHSVSSRPYWEMAKYLKEGNVEYLPHHKEKKKVTHQIMLYCAMIRGCERSLKELINRYERNSKFYSTLIKIKKEWKAGDKYSDDLIKLYFDYLKKFDLESKNQLQPSLLEVLIKKINFNTCDRVYNQIRLLALDVLRIEGNDEKYQNYFEKIKEIKKGHLSSDESTVWYAKLEEARSKNNMEEMEEAYKKLIVIYKHLGKSDKILGEFEYILGISYQQKYEKDRKINYLNNARSYFSFAYDNGMIIACFHLYKLFLFEKRSPFSGVYQGKNKSENKQKLKTLTAEWFDKLLISVIKDRKVFKKMEHSDLLIVLEAIISAIFIKKYNFFILIDLYCYLSKLLFETEANICYSLAKSLERKSEGKLASEVTLAIPIFYFLSFLHGFHPAVDPLIRYLFNIPCAETKELIEDLINEELRLQPALEILYADNEEKLEKSRKALKINFQYALLKSLQQVISGDTTTIAKNLLGLKKSASITAVWQLEEIKHDDEPGIRIDDSYDNFVPSSTMDNEINEWEKLLRSESLTIEEKQLETGKLIKKIIACPTDTIIATGLIGKVYFIAGVYYFDSNENKEIRSLAKNYLYKADQCGILAAKFYLLKLFALKDNETLGSSLLTKTIKADYLLTLAEFYHSSKKTLFQLGLKAKYDLYMMINEPNNFLQEKDRRFLAAVGLDIISDICQFHPAFSGPYYAYSLCWQNLNRIPYYFLDVLYGGKAAIEALSTLLAVANLECSPIANIFNQLKIKIDTDALYDDESISYLEDFCDEFIKYYSSINNKEEKFPIGELTLGVANALIQLGKSDFALETAARLLIKKPKSKNTEIYKKLVSILKDKNINLDDKSLLNRNCRPNQKANASILSKMAILASIAKDHEKQNDIEKVTTDCEEIIQLARALSEPEKNNADLQFAEYTLGVLYAQSFFTNNLKDYKRAQTYLINAITHGLTDALYWKIKLIDTALRYANASPPSFEIDETATLIARATYLSNLSSNIPQKTNLTYLSKEQKLDLASIFLEQYVKDVDSTEGNSNYKGALAVYELIYKAPGKAQYILAKNIEIFAKQANRPFSIGLIGISNLFSSFCYGRKDAGIGLVVSLSVYSKDNNLNDLSEKLREILSLQCLYLPIHPEIINQLKSLAVLIGEAVIHVKSEKDAFIINLLVKLANVLLHAYSHDVTNTSLFDKINNIIDKISAISKNHPKVDLLKYDLRKILNKQKKASSKQVKTGAALKTSISNKDKLSKINEEIQLVNNEIAQTDDIDAKIRLSKKLIALTEAFVQQNSTKITFEINERLQNVYLQAGRVHYEKHVQTKDANVLNLAKHYFNLSACNGSISAVYFLQKAAGNKWLFSRNKSDAKLFKMQQYLLLLSDRFNELDLASCGCADKGRELFEIYLQTKAHLKINNPTYIQEKLSQFSIVLLQALRANATLLPKPYYDLAKFYSKRRDENKNSTDNSNMRDAKLHLFQMNMALNYCSSFFFGEVKGLVKLKNFFNSNDKENKQKSNNIYKNIYNILSKIEKVVVQENKINSGEFYKPAAIVLYKELVAAFNQFFAKNNSKFITDLTFDIILSLVHQPLIAAYKKYNWEALDIASEWLSCLVKLSGEGDRYLSLQKIIEEKKSTQPENTKVEKVMKDWTVEGSVTKKNKRRKGKKKKKKISESEKNCNKASNLAAASNPIHKEEGVVEHKENVPDDPLRIKNIAKKKERTSSEKRLSRRKRRIQIATKERQERSQQKEFNKKFVNPIIYGGSISQENEEEHKRGEDNYEEIEQARKKDNGESIPPLVADIAIEKIDTPYKDIIVEEFKQISLPLKVTKFLTEFSPEIELVGGYVRDYVLSRLTGGLFKYNDFDFVCGDPLPSKEVIPFDNYFFRLNKKRIINNVLRIFSDYHNNCEIYYGEERFQLGIRADAFSRDFTVNTLLFKFINGEFKLLDPTGRGYQDLLNKKISTVKPFEEAFMDPRLLFRCFYLVSLGYTPEFDLEKLKGFYLHLYDIRKITPAEIYSCLSKIFKKELYLENFDLYIKYNLLQTLFPAISLFHFAWLRKIIQEFSIKKDLTQVALVSYFIIAEFRSCLDKRLVYYYDPRIFEHDLHIIMAKMRLPVEIIADVMQFNYNFIFSEVREYMQIKEAQIREVQMQQTLFYNQQPNSPLQQENVYRPPANNQDYSSARFYQPKQPSTSKVNSGNRQAKYAVVNK